MKEKKKLLAKYIISLEVGLFSHFFFAFFLTGTKFLPQFKTDEKTRLNTMN